MCHVAFAATPAEALDALVPTALPSPHLRRLGARAQAAIFRNDEAKFRQLLPQVDWTWRDPNTQHTLLVEATLRCRVHMVRMLCRRLKSPAGLEQRSEALVHLLQSWPHQPTQSHAYHSCLSALLGEGTLSDLPLPANGNGWLALAINSQNQALLESLVAFGASKEECCPGGGSLLHAVTESEAMGLLSWSLGQGCDPNGADAIGETPLHIAARCGNLGALIQLVEAGGSLEVANQDGETPLAFFENLGESGWAWYRKQKAQFLGAALGPASDVTHPKQRF